jgi:uncharacterized hydrophobic protein (TIGR00271 family)
MKAREKLHRNTDHRTLHTDQSGLLDRWFRRLRLIAGLQSGTDIEATVVRIRSGVRLRGANLWILVCAALLASIGLNTSSVAVIIGAMLISPLMGPILGIGLGIAIHDRAMLLRAFRTFGTSVGLSLLTSTIYFWLTPFTHPTAELLARASPTLLDVGVAFFGGIAGIVAGSRREITTAIPGVAIATALMPPLCTAGYGIAINNWTFFLGAFYLFFLNAVFISLATFLIVRLLKIPFATYVDPAVERRAFRWIAVITLAALIPSIILFYDVIRELRDKNRAERFVHEQLEVHGRKALSWTIEPSDSGRVLRAYLAGRPFSPEQVDSLSQNLAMYGLTRERLRLIQLNLPGQITPHVDREELLDMLHNPELQRELAASMVLSSEIAAQPSFADTIPMAAIRREMLTVFGTLVDITHAQQLIRRNDTTDTVHMFLVQQTPRSSIRERHDELLRMRSFLKARVEADSVHIVSVEDISDSAAAIRR